MLPESVSHHGVDEGGQIAALAAADAVQLLGELLIGDGQIGIAGAFTHHGAGHEGVDDSGIGGAGLHFHQCLGLRVYGYNVVAVGQCHFLTGGTGFHCVGQLGDFSRLGRIGGGGAGISGGLGLGTAGSQRQNHHSREYKCSQLFHVPFLLKNCSSN